MDSRKLLAEDGADTTYSFVALPEASIVIGRNLSRFGPAPRPPSLYRLLPSGEFDAAFGPGGAFEVTGIPVVEYCNVGLGHYFITASDAEMANIDAGSAGPGWKRTGNGFLAFAPHVGVPVGARLRSLWARCGTPSNR